MEEYPESDFIEPDRARYLYENHCAVLVVENMPIGSEFGIDLMTYRVGQKFKGVKLIPPGIHFIYSSACPKRQENNPITNGPRCGFFHHFKQKEVLITRWSLELEEFEDDFKPDEQLVERYILNLRELDPYLGAYSYSTYKTFLNLTNKLTVEIVDHLNPECKKIRSVPFLTREEKVKEDIPIIGPSSALPRRQQKLLEDDLLPDLKPLESTVINFTRIPKDHLGLGEKLEGRKLTEYNLDTSQKLDHLFKSVSHGNDQILAEFQFSFITFLLCHVYECFEHWKKLLGLLTNVDENLKKYLKFYSTFLEILQYQLEQIPDDLFMEINDSDNLIRTHLDTLFQNLAVLQMDDSIIKRANKLRYYLEKKFDWQFNLERDDEQPVIVDL